MSRSFQKISFSKKIKAAVQTRLRQKYGLAYKAQTDAYQVKGQNLLVRVDELGVLCKKGFIAQGDKKNNGDGRTAQNGKHNANLVFDGR